MSQGSGLLHGKLCTVGSYAPQCPCPWPRLNKAGLYVQQRESFRRSWYRFLLAALVDLGQEALKHRPFQTITFVDSTDPLLDLAHGVLLVLLVDLL